MVPTTIPKCGRTAKKVRSIFSYEHFQYKIYRVKIFLRLVYLSSTMVAVTTAATAQSLDEAVRAQLTAAVIQATTDGSYTPEDVLRSYKEQAMLLYETEKLKAALVSDPFQHLDQVSQAVSRLSKLLRVTEYHAVTTLEGYCRMDATVQFCTVAVTTVALRFRYLRSASRNCDDRQVDLPVTVSYSIDLCKDFEPAERLLWVHVQASGSTPSSFPARNVVADNDEHWSDMEDSDNDEPGKSSSAGPLPTANGNAAHVDHMDASTKSEFNASMGPSADPSGPCEPAIDQGDAFVAGMDPDVLTKFLLWTNIGDMDDITSFFLLMTFQFYELEWDLVGYLLEGVFGPDDDDEAGDDDAGNDDESG
jgi:hypothetical protein